MGVLLGGNGKVVLIGQPSHYKGVVAKTDSHNKAQPRVAVVIPNWNGVDLIKPCLESLQAQTAKDFSIVVVDNGSSDDSISVIKTQFPKVEVIELDRNYGFTGGVNAGIRRAKAIGCRYVALFNNDAVADKKWLQSLIETAEEHPQAGIVTSRFVSIDGKTIDSTGDFYSIWGLPFPRGRGEPNGQNFQTTESVFGGSGGASLYRVRALDQVGLFDDDFFAYYEDVDLSFRMQLAGWSVIYDHHAIAFHRTGSTSSRMLNHKTLAKTKVVTEKPSPFSRYHSTKNFFMLYLKNMPAPLFWKYLTRFLLAGALMGFNCLRTDQFWPYLKGVAKAVWLTPKTLAKRWRIQRQAQTPATEIEALLYPALPPTQLKAIRFMAKWGLK